MPFPKSPVESYSDECTVLMFYGVAPSPESICGFWNVAGRWFQGMGCPPDKAAIRGLGYGRKWTSFDTANTKLENKSFADITAAAMVCLTPKARIPSNDYLVYAEFSSVFRYISFVARTSILPLSKSTMLPFVQELVDIVKPSYGIAYSRLHSLGPVSYGLGMVHGIGPDRSESENICRWVGGMSNQVWQNGLLRDVYPLNFLSGPHLKRPVGAVTLEQWIMEDVQRGQLEHLDDRLWFWEVPAANLEAIRKTLQAENIIF